MQRDKRISECELEIMKIVWTNDGPTKSTDIIKDLRQTRDWEDNTIYTMITRLTKKGFLVKTKFKNVSIYEAAVSENDYIMDETEGFIERLFDGNTSKLVSMLFQNKRIKQEDVDYLRKYWEEDDNG